MYRVVAVRSLVRGRTVDPGGFTTFAPKVLRGSRPFGLRRDRYSGARQFAAYRRACSRHRLSCTQHIQNVKRSRIGELCWELQEPPLPLIIERKTGSQEARISTRSSGTFNALADVFFQVSHFSIIARNHS